LEGKRPRLVAEQQETSENPELDFANMKWSPYNDEKRHTGRLALLTDKSLCAPSN
jgi:hypothetical protein